MTPTSPRAPLWLVLVPAIALLTGLVVAHAWVCDDAFIAFRYSRNFAHGFGLRYNVGIDPPVEGYTQLGWVLWIAIFEWLSLDPLFWSQVTGLAAGIALLCWVTWFARRRLALGALATAATALFFATSPTVVLWATGGLETMCYALAIFVTCERLLGDPERSRTVPVALAALVTLILRADAAYWIGLVFAVAGWRALATGHRALLRRTIVCGAVVAAAMGAHMLWRLSYYHDWVPNTARAKVGISLPALHRGWDYLAHYWLVMPATFLALVLAVVSASRRGEWWARTCAVMAGGTFLYGVLVSGDFMTMGRFYVPAIPFLALAVGIAIQGLVRTRARPLAWPLLVASLVGSVPALFDLHVTPESWRDQVRFRWGGRGAYVSEYAYWARSVENERRWTDMGRAVGRFAAKDSSLVHRTIGALGYYSNLVIYDGAGLVNREVVEKIKVDPNKLGTPSHDRYAGAAFFAKHHPTYGHAEVFYADESEAAARFANNAPEKLEVHPFRREEGYSEDGQLLLWRF